MGRSKYRDERIKHDNGTCCNCGAPATQVHHVVPEALGGFDILTNLVSLCDDCHGKVHGRKSVDLSALTKQGLQRARERGVKLGGTGGTHAALAASNLAKKKRAEEHTSKVAPLVSRLREQGHTLRGIAEVLNLGSVPAPKGGKWGVGQVHRVLKAAAGV